MTTRSTEGVTVRTDDLVVADATGVVIVPGDEVGAVAETAEKMLDEELLIEKNSQRHDDLGPPTGRPSVLDAKADVHATPLCGISIVESRSARRSC